MKKRLQAGFMIAEFLLVISFISAISSSLLLSWYKFHDGKSSNSVSRDTVYRNPDFFGAWNFNERSGNALDISGNKRDLKPVTGVLARSSTTTTGYGHSYALSTGGGYASVSFASTTIGDSTTSVWINFTSAVGADSTILALSNTADATQPLVMSGSSRFFTCYSALLGSGVGLSKLQLNRWYNITCSIDTTTGKSSLFLNGTLVGTGATGGPVTLPAPALPMNTISVGGDAISGRTSPQFDGFIDDVVVYRRALTLAQVQTIFAQGAAAHGLAVR